MKRSVKDEKTGIMYELIGDYYYPCLVGTEKIGIGRYGKLRAKYLKENHRVWYYNLLTSGKLEKYLRDIDVSAYEMRERLIKDMAKAQGITEKLKATDMLKWVGLMNNIRSCAEEIVLHDIIYS